MEKYSNCITPQGKFIFGIHKPSYGVTNLRKTQNIESLGIFDDNSVYLNTANYPDQNIEVKNAKWIFEVPNPFPFRGTTYIDKEWADASAEDPSRMYLPKPEPLAFTRLLEQNNIDEAFISALPQPLLLTLAICSTEADDLIQLAELSCECIKDENGTVTGLCYTRSSNGQITPIVINHDLFEAVANNPSLPDEYKRAMVLRPGAQGLSEIVGEWKPNKSSHIYEYLRSNSYIPGGHFAANMADDSVRYSIGELNEQDMQGLRHLYYQRMYVRIAELLGHQLESNVSYTTRELEKLRLTLLETIDKQECSNLSTLWGWNFGFDYSPTNYRLHASHQQIHQQYAVIPEQVDAYNSGSDNPAGTITAFSSGDMIAKSIDDYYNQYASDLFTDYFSSIRNNSRMDNRDNLPSSLIVWEDNHVMIIVPKAQTSQWELQILIKPDAESKLPGNIIEADIHCRQSLDTAILKAQQVLEKLGAKMVTSIEFSKRIADRDRSSQPLIYSLLPKLPFSPGAFSEAQLRFINGHYPEDFAALCRFQL